MAAPITEIYNPITEEDIKQQKIEELKDLLTENEEMLNTLFSILGDLNDSGILGAANSMLKGKEEITKILLGQVTREPVTNLINTLMGATGAIMKANPDQATKLISSALAGVEEGSKFLETEKKISIMNLMKVLSDPDINRAIGFGINFLKGMGKELKEDK